MKLLVVGSGGREHAIAWKLAQSAKTTRVYVAPGNAGTALEPGVQNIDITDIAELVKFAKDEHIAYTVVGPEAPLAAGIVDTFRAAGLKIWGPTRYCAQLESSKAFAKSFLERHNIPTAKSAVFTDIEEAKAYVEQQGAPIVIKADGLAAGKGVVVAMTLEEAHAALEGALSGNKFGEAGHRVVVEAFLEGEEVSFIVMAHGRQVISLATSQDHKRLLEGDRGPNTGGMGAYSPASIVTPALHARIIREIINPTLQGMLQEGHSYTGFLYAGLMIDAKGNPQVIEFNCRLGDPETQPILMRLKSDFVTLIEQGIEGELDQANPEWDRRTAIGVVLAAANYPETPKKGDAIQGLPRHNSWSDETRVFHAGSELNESGTIVTNGGRVLCITSLGDTVRIAQKNAYHALEDIYFEGMQFRPDIGYRAIR
ncbi:MAG: phosphoribosylamine--glycine ligase [Pseudomonadota bacterium]